MTEKIYLGQYGKSAAQVMQTQIIDRYIINHNVTIDWLYNSEQGSCQWRFASSCSATDANLKHKIFNHYDFFSK